MGIEKRQYERLVIPGDVYINHRENEIHCTIENISNYGAYLKVENVSHLNGMEIGDSVSFRISTPDIAERELSGRILRHTVEKGSQYLAVYFFQQYTFD